MKSMIRKVLDERKRKIDSGDYKKPENMKFDELISRFGNMSYGLTTPIPIQDDERAKHISNMIKLNGLTGKDKEEFEAKINEIAKNYKKSGKGDAVTWDSNMI